MCSLIVLRGVAPDYSLIVAANRDERTDRKAAPPGLWHGDQHRVLSPRDRVAGGTWLGVNEHGVFAGLTNVHGEPPVEGAPSRGHLPHLALDQGSLGEGLAAVRSRIDGVRHSGFQLVLADRERCFVIRNAGGSIEQLEWGERVLSITNEHAAGDWSPRDLEPALADSLSPEGRLDALAAVLRDRGGDGHHAVCKHGATYATVSSSLLAIPAAGDMSGLVWRYAAGPPDVVRYRNYSNLAQRLQAD